MAINNLQEPNSRKSNYTIVIVEDDDGLRHLINKRLELDGFRTITLNTGKEVLDYIDKKSDNVIIILDFKLPDISGKEIAEKIVAEEKNIPFIVMTGHGDEQTAVEMMKLGARDYLVKESNFVELLVPVINQTVQQIELEKKLTQVVLTSREKDSLMMMQSRQASLGEMVGNVTCQWNSPLNMIKENIHEVYNDFINGNLEKDKFEKVTNDISYEIDKLTSIITDFQAFFKPETEKNTFELDKIVRKAIKLIEPALKNNNIAIEVDLQEGIKIHGYQNEYIQVILILLNNSMDVLLQRKIENPIIKIFLRFEDNSSILTVTDNAGGISENLVNKIFDPYFTTKKGGEGTGLGLYLSKSFIERDMGGKLTARNADRGMEFKIEIKYIA